MHFNEGVNSSQAAAIMMLIEGVSHLPSSSNNIIIVHDINYHAWYRGRLYTSPTAAAAAAAAILACLAPSPITITQIQPISLIGESTIIGIND